MVGLLSETPSAGAGVAEGVIVDHPLRVPLSARHQVRVDRQRLLGGGADRSGGEPLVEIAVIRVTLPVVVTVPARGLGGGIGAGAVQQFHRVLLIGRRVNDRSQLAGFERFQTGKRSGHKTVLTNKRFRRYNPPSLSARLMRRSRRNVRGNNLNRRVAEP